ncbi:MAG: competence protein CoiA family protein [Promethearchaeota archaeon]
MASLLATKSETFYHKTMKEMIFRKIKVEGNARFAIKEKRINRCQPDVFIQLRNGKKVAVEVQHSPKTIKEIITKNYEYANNNIYVLWILHARGLCVEDPKLPVSKKNVKISSVEHFLHNIYGGRVYYIDFNEDRKTMTPPYALYFHCRKKRNKKPHKRGYRWYYIRDMYLTYIPSWNIVCNDFGKYKIARFYDRGYNISKKRKKLKKN